MSVTCTSDAVAVAEVLVTTSRHAKSCPTSAFALSGQPAAPVVFTALNVGKSSTTLTASEPPLV